MRASFVQEQLVRSGVALACFGDLTPQSLQEVPSVPETLICLSSTSHPAPPRAYLLPDFLGAAGFKGAAYLCAFGHPERVGMRLGVIQRPRAELRTLWGLKLV